MKLLHKSSQQVDLSDIEASKTINDLKLRPIALQELERISINNLSIIAT